MNLLFNFIDEKKSTKKKRKKQTQKRIVDRRRTSKVVKDIKPSIKFIKKYDVFLNGINMEFAVSTSAKANDPYMIADWLDKKILVVVNTKHPFYLTAITNKEKKDLYFTMLAEDAFIQWQISRHSARITASKVLELKDYVKREFSINLKGLKRK
jgi:hypothetical protein